MKKHVACHWLNIIAEDVRRTIKYRQEEIEKWAADLTVEALQKEHRSKYSADQIAECEQKLLALDIAGDALTK